MSLQARDKLPSRFVSSSRPTLGRIWHRPGLVFALSAEASLLEDPIVCKPSLVSRVHRGKNHSNKKRSCKRLCRRAVTVCCQERPK